MNYTMTADVSLLEQDRQAVKQQSEEFDCPEKQLPLVEECMARKHRVVDKVKIALLMQGIREVEKTVMRALVQAAGMAMAGAAPRG